MDEDRLFRVINTGLLVVAVIAIITLTLSHLATDARLRRAYPELDKPPEQ